MQTPLKVLKTLALALVGAGLMATGAMAQGHNLLGTDCDAPPQSHCVDASTCVGPLIMLQGRTTEPKTRRMFFLDCPAGYKRGDKVNVVLSLHGAGSFANWQRNYFPIMDVKDKYKLVIITPSSPTQVWAPEDDQYLANMVDLVVGQVGKENVQRFILAGHSQGGMTSNRIICTPYFRDKVDVRISLSGGRIGATTPAGRGFAGGTPVYQQASAPDGPPGAAQAAAGAARPPAPPAAGPPGGDCDYSFIFSNGEYESIPAATSPLADKFGCAARVQLPDVIDSKAGLAWDSSRQDPGADGWGRFPKSGRAWVYQFPNCKDGRVVADVVKLRKGHTEGYEPNITDKIMALAVSAKGGKIATGSWSPPAIQPAVGLGPPGGGFPAPSAAGAARR